MNTKIAILQSNYLPWRGVFELINKVDIFVFHDDIQFTYQDWRTRNKIISKDGLSSDWITIPTGKKEKLLINQVELPDNNWRKKHLNKITESYRNHEYFEETFKLISPLILNNITNLSEFNINITTKIYNSIFEDNNKSFIRSSELNLVNKKSDRVLEILKKLNGNYYLSGPSAKDYLEEDKFAREGIHLEYINYTKIPYPQKSSSFINNLSIIDLMMNVGINHARQFIAQG